MAKIKPIVKARQKRVKIPSIFYGADRSFIYAKTHNTSLPKVDPPPVSAVQEVPAPTVSFTEQENPERTTWKAKREKKKEVVEKAPLPIAVQELPETEVPSQELPPED